MRTELSRRAERLDTSALEGMGARVVRLRTDLRDRGGLRSAAFTTSVGRKLEADASAPKEPERARVPEGKQECKEKTTDNGQRPVWEAVQAHDEHLGGEGA